MGVAAHLGIKVADYDARIRTFIPDYEEMLASAATAIPGAARRIVDLGCGTGALSKCCLAKAPRARIFGIDADPDILKLAEQRVGRRGVFVCRNFLRVAIPACDVVVASFALHHVRTLAAKARLYRRIRRALRPGGRVITVDCNPARDATVARDQYRAWAGHLLRSYPRIQAAAFLRSWSREDVYVPLETELRLIEGAGLATEVWWRKDAFAVLMASRRQG